MKRRAAQAKRRYWSPDEDAQLRALYPHATTANVARQLGRTLCSVNARANAFQLHKSAAYLASPAACRLRRGGDDHPGRKTQFKKGQIPANKGLRRPGWAPGRMRETQFKKGTRQGRAQAIYKPVGTERLSKDGYRERKVSEAMPFQRRWRAVHLLVWEAVHGPLPAGHAIAFKNGDKRDVRLENLECITRRELMARNSVHNLPTPLKQTVQLLGALHRKINRRSKASDAKQDRRSA